MKIKTNKIIIRKEIKEKPTQNEINAIKQYGQDVNNYCLDCRKPLYYFNQCNDCYDKMILRAKVG